MKLKPPNADFASLPYIAFPEMDAQLQSSRVMMNWADPFRSASRVPQHVIDAVKQALDEGKTYYTVPIGSLELRKAISRRVKGLNGITADPSTEIIVTPGSDAGLFHAMSVIVAHGDEVIVPEPSYASNSKNSVILGATPVPLILRREENYQINKACLTKILSEKTKLIVLTQPNNPTGTLLNRDSLQAVREVALENGLYVVVDQAFEATVFDGNAMISIAALPDMWDRTITVCSMSKAMGMSGFRLGYNVASKALMQAMHNSAVLILGTANTFAQFGAIAALENCDFVQEFNRVYDQRRHALHDALRDIPGVHMDLPEAGFFAWIDVSALGGGKAVAHYIDEAEGILVGAVGFGSSVEGFIRIVYGAVGDDAVFNASIQKIASALRRLARSQRAG
jgi:aspartate/methionine/tyrosine aminotransferase